MISFFSNPYVYQSIFTGLATINHLPTSQENPPHPIFLIWLILIYRNFSPQIVYNLRFINT